MMRRIFLIDCPGVVYPSEDSESDIVLKGVVSLYFSSHSVICVVHTITIIQWRRIICAPAQQIETVSRSSPRNGEVAGPNLKLHVYFPPFLSQVQVEKIKNPEEHIEAVLERAKPEYIQKTYRIPSWNSAENFLEKLAFRTGKLLKV